ncbi:hypothetical protein [Acetobacter persici]|uniref:hypothetical protein n=1 Tax=Acetobacter persici TaxID=1076596 RepID=UPI001BA5EED7|nr:hypothetical protein [Acetobacter persici]MBS0962668.1 hypothetical protein [Acetobacter persici]
MSPNEIKQSVIDIVHQETWKTASLTTAAILSFGLIIAFVTKNWFLNWIQNRVSHGFNQQLEAYRAELQEKAANYQNEIQQKFEMFKTVTSQIQDRRTRSNEHEYDACIECWNAIQKACQSTFNLCQDTKISVSINKKTGNISIKSKFDFDFDFDFTQDEIELLEQLDTESKIEMVVKRSKEKELERCNDNVDNAIFLIQKKSIFISEDLYKSFSSLLLLLSYCCEEKVNIFENPYAIIDTPYTEMVLTEGAERFRLLEKVLRANLHIRAMDFTDQSQRDAVAQSQAPQPSSSGNTPEPEPTAPK